MPRELLPATPPACRPAAGCLAAGAAGQEACAAPGAPWPKLPTPVPQDDRPRYRFAAVPKSARFTPGGDLVLAAKLLGPSPTSPGEDLTLLSRPVAVHALAPGGAWRSLGDIGPQLAAGEARAALSWVGLSAYETRNATEEEAGNM